MMTTQSGQRDSTFKNTGDFYPKYIGPNTNLSEIDFTDGLLEDLRDSNLNNSDLSYANLSLLDMSAINLRESQSNSKHSHRNKREGR